MKAELADTRRLLSRSRLRAISAVAEEGTFAAAARRLGLSHAAISQQIREMEAAYGLRLFERQHGAMRPTPICLELTEIGQRIQDAESDAVRILDRRDETGMQRLRLGLGNAMPGIAIAGQMLSQHKAISISVESGSHQDILAAILRREVDVAVLPDIPADRRFLRLPVLSQDVVAIVGAQSRYASRREITLQDLADEPLIFRSRGSSTQKVVDRAFRAAGLSPVPQLTADTRDAVHEAVTLGIGIGFMWRHGTMRTDTVIRLDIPAMGAAVEEVVFALKEERNPLVDLFFKAAENYRSSPALMTP
ncbi:LysR family transcriptional regulator [Seohaeicola saemankumensis]|jgi:LysR family transcriptional regulator, low CO2-responsive transcriptional regulator|uniref:LysR substrate-binding domain-containing protein n=1 Tax=Seohaeicola TaxID=481178 RepID=UPI0035CF1882